ncbi:MAG: pyridoxal phosphate-dependent aminotransferase, partial [Gemmatimonadaceae bacterium]
MRIETFAMERLQSRWEHVVDCDLSESGARAVSLAELTDWGLDLRELLVTPLGYSQTNGTAALRDSIAALYPGATCDHVLVTNGTAEANYVVFAALLADAHPSARCAMELPNYMQAAGLTRYWARGGVETFHLRFDQAAAATHGGWRLGWEEVERVVRPGTTAVYITHPNNPTGAVLPEPEMRQLAARCDQVGAWLVVDEVYLGTEIDRPRSPTFYGMGER